MIQPHKCTKIKPLAWWELIDTYIANQRKKWRTHPKTLAQKSKHSLANTRSLLTNTMFQKKSAVGHPEPLYNANALSKDTQDIQDSYRNSTA